MGNVAIMFNVKVPFHWDSTLKVEDSKVRNRYLLSANFAKLGYQEADWLKA